MYEIIKHEHLQFDSSVPDLIARPLIERLLEKDPLKRLSSFEEVKTDRYFTGFDW